MSETGAWIALHEALQKTIEKALCRVGIKLEHGQGSHTGVCLMVDEIERLRAVIEAYQDITCAYRLGRRPKERSLDLVNDY